MAAPLEATAVEVDVERDLLAGLSTLEAAQLRLKWGRNAVPKTEVPAYVIFGRQLMGTMPFMLELACIASVTVGDYSDGAVLLTMLLLNACLGYHEQMKAKSALDELTNRLEAQVSCKRDGETVRVDVSDLVPGDVVFIAGGDTVPADVKWVRGDVLSVDTAAMTGESLPRKYPSDAYGTEIYSGCTIMSGSAYCLVTSTGINTEMGASMSVIAADRARGAEVSVFERRVVKVMQYVVAVSICIVLTVVFIAGYARNTFNHGEGADTILLGLSIIIAAIPIALPLLLQVTMAIGAARMAREHSSIVTRTAALQDIAAMEVLCSDKTGTLTTAKMSVVPEKAAAFDGHEVQDVLLYARLASNADKATDDPIDAAVCAAYANSVVPGSAEDVMHQYAVHKEYGFTPLNKRMVVERIRHGDGAKIIVAKGLVSKILDTTNDGADDSEMQWRCQRYEETARRAAEADEALGTAGYKTIGVAISNDDGRTWSFVGLLPMMDPPRFDSALTIDALRGAGVETKMITGDHLNVAKETARLLGLDPTTIYPADRCRGTDAATLGRIRAAAGFAQVLPRDKRFVVQRLKRDEDNFHDDQDDQDANANSNPDAEVETDSFTNVFAGLCGSSSTAPAREEMSRDDDTVVGMTGDGVNDAPALSAAQCGIAVDGATDAAKNAAAIVLTTPGLSAIYSAVVESRNIFARLRAYVTYRFAATIHAVSYLSILSIWFECQLKPLYVIILALANDISMMPVAEDNATPAARPVKPGVGKLLGLAATYGTVMCCTSLLFYALAVEPHFGGDFMLGRSRDGIRGVQSSMSKCSRYTQSAVFLQISIIAELLIFSTRAPNTFFFMSCPSLGLVCSTATANVVVTVLCLDVTGFGDLQLMDVVWIWAYDLVVLCLCDCAKLAYNSKFEDANSFNCLPTVPGSGVSAFTSSRGYGAADETQRKKKKLRAGGGTKLVPTKATQYDGSDDEDAVPTSATPLLASAFR